MFDEFVGKLESLGYDGTLFEANPNSEKQGGKSPWPAGAQAAALTACRRLELTLELHTRLFDAFTRTVRDWAQTAARGHWNLWPGFHPMNRIKHLIPEHRFPRGRERLTTLAASSAHSVWKPCEALFHETCRSPTQSVCDADQRSSTESSSTDIRATCSKVMTSGATTALWKSTAA